MDITTLLPEEIICKIALYLPSPHSVFQFSLSCKRLFDILWPSAKTITNDILHPKDISFSSNPYADPERALHNFTRMANLFPKQSHFTFHMQNAPSPVEAVVVSSDGSVAAVLARASQTFIPDNYFTGLSHNRHDRHQVQNHDTMRATGVTENNTSMGTCTSTAHNLYHDAQETLDTVSSALNSVVIHLHDILRRSWHTIHICKYYQELTAMQLSPDGKYLALGTYQGVILIAFDRTATCHSSKFRLHQLFPLQFHQHCFCANIDFSPDSKTLIAVSNDQVAHLWALDHLYTPPYLLSSIQLNRKLPYSIPFSNYIDESGSDISSTCTLTISHDSKYMLGIVYNRQHLVSSFELWDLKSSSYPRPTRVSRHLVRSSNMYISPKFLYCAPADSARRPYDENERPIKLFKNAVQSTADHMIIIFAVLKLNAIEMWDAVSMKIIGIYRCKSIDTEALGIQKPPHLLDIGYGARLGAQIDVRKLQPYERQVALKDDAIYQNLTFDQRLSFVMKIGRFLYAVSTLDVSTAVAMVVKDRSDLHQKNLHDQITTEDSRRLSRYGSQTQASLSSSPSRPEASRSLRSSSSLAATTPSVPSPAPRARRNHMELFPQETLSSNDIRIDVDVDATMQQVLSLNSIAPPMGVMSAPLRFQRAIRIRRASGMDEAMRIRRLEEINAVLCSYASCGPWVVFVTHTDASFRLIENNQITRNQPGASGDGAGSSGGDGESDTVFSGSRSHGIVVSVMNIINS